MIDIDKIITIAKEKDASDVHLIFANRPILRIRRDLVEIDWATIVPHYSAKWKMC
jgi:Tfp pilus assembly pilus retraction ATPase PilT